MQEHPWKDLLLKAQNQDIQAREIILENSYNFILKTASRYCRRHLDWDNDDELSISLLAFNEAIDGYDFSKNVSFYNYSRMVIQRRLVDYFRKEGKHRLAPLENQKEEDEEYTGVSLEAKVSFKEYLRQRETLERKMEIEILSQELHDYQLSMEVLEKKAPRHRDTRENLVKAAQTLVNHPILLQHLREKKQLPLKGLSKATGLSIKVLKKGRPYLVALTLIMSNPELVYLRSYLHLSPKGDENHE